LFLEEVYRFENCEYGLHEFDHRKHLKVAWTYLRLFDYDTALDRMREGLLRFTRHHNATGYNETITVFWMRVLRMHERDDAGIVIENVRKDLIFRHFSPAVVNSDQARRHWVEPDLLPLHGR